LLLAYQISLLVRGYASLKKLVVYPFKLGEESTSILDKHCLISSHIYSEKAIKSCWCSEDNKRPYL